MKLIKNLNDLLIGILIGGVVIGGGVYATALAASAVTYSNTTSKLSSTNAQGAVDALYLHGDGSVEIVEPSNGNPVKQQA